MGRYKLEDTFRANFQGTYVRPPDADDLSHIIQQSGESARKLWNMFLTKKKKIVDYRDTEALAAFKHSVQDEWLARHLGQEKPRTTATLTSLMTRFCAGEDSWLAYSSTNDPSTSEIRDGNGKPRRRKDRRRNKEKSPKNTAVNTGFKSSRLSNKTLPLKDNSDELSNLKKIGSDMSNPQYLRKACKPHPPRLLGFQTVWPTQRRTQGARHTKRGR